MFAFITVILRINHLNLNILIELNYFKFHLVYVIISHKVIKLKFYISQDQNRLN